jgi:hypothetical protein
MIRRIHELESASSAFSHGENPGENVLHFRAVKCRPCRQRPDPRVTGGKPRSLRRKAIVRSAGADHDPVGIVATLRGETNRSLKGSAFFQFEDVPAGSVIDCVLQVAAGFYLVDFSG